MKLFAKREHLVTSPWESYLDKVTTPFEEFIHNQKTSGMLLIAMTLIALAIVNSGFADPYQHILHMQFGVALNGWDKTLSLHHWINDGLMALFFFLVGLEIKREFLTGGLSDIRNAVLPIVAAIGGMVTPAAIYFAVNAGTPTVDGWGIPMATDIAFALTALILLGTRVPKSLVTFLVALAIVDDLGAVGVIALFYTDTISTTPLLVSLALFGLLLVLNRSGVNSVAPYLIVGIVMWIAMLSSGIHATVAGVLTALAIPALPKFNPEYFGGHIRNLRERFDGEESGHRESATQKGDNHRFSLSEGQSSVVAGIEDAARKVQPPLNRLEHALHVPVGLVIIPLFALANAGVLFSMDLISSLTVEPVALGILLGLVVGKPLGVFGFSWLSVKLGFGKLPEGTNWTQLFGVSVLAGIGFTMSIFITELAFKGMASEIIEQAKMAVMISSLIAAVVGFVLLMIASGNRGER